MPTPISRRLVLKGLASAAIVGPSIVFARAPARNERVALAAVGVGGRGSADIAALMSSPHAKMVALCDVDQTRLAPMAKRYPAAATFADYRVMFDRMAPDIDAVLIATPDHMHAPIALAAMALGKHVYIQKPLAHNLAELRSMVNAADRSGVATQMGTQVHASDAYRTAAAMIQADAIGKVREAHLWVSKSWSGPATGRPDRVDPIPDHLDWDLWLGVAPNRPFAAGTYHPGSWRRWKDFGTGTLGDMGCHIFDPVFSALSLKDATSVRSQGPASHAETFAPNTDMRYTFAPTPLTDGELSLRWTDGSGPSRPDAARAHLPDGVKLPGAGSFMVGERGVMVLPHWGMPRFYADGKPMDIPINSAGSTNHFHEWIDACRGQGSTSTPLSYAGPVTEAVLLGVVAADLPGQTLAWNSAQLTFDNPSANAKIARTYHPKRSITTWPGIVPPTKSPKP